jgi:cyclase
VIPPTSHALRVAICRYGAGNVRSVELALARVGCEIDASAEADVADADLVVLPGVGSARSAMAGLRDRGLDVELRDRVAAGRPVLGICLGLQLALDWTDEDGGVPGLGLAPGRAVRLTSGRVPRMGWAALDADPEGPAYYFAHSYAAESPATTARSEGVAVEVRAGSFVGCQFHPLPGGAARRGRRPAGGLMPLPRLIPCLDVADGRVVKGVNFDGLRDVGHPVELAAAYEAYGADELVFLDVRATLDDRRTLLHVVQRVAEQVSIPFTVGGGVRTVADATDLLAAGADKVGVNSAALARPGLVGELADRLGTQAVVVAIDAKNGLVRSRAGTAGTDRTAVDWAREAAARGAGEILLTSIDTDGTRTGYDLALTAAVAAAVDLPVIASGGAGTTAHVAAALDVAQAALLASILHERPARLGELREELRALGVPVREPARV